MIPPYGTRRIFQLAVIAVIAAQAIKVCVAGMLTAGLRIVQNPPARKMDCTKPDADSPAGIGKTVGPPEYAMLICVGG